MSGLSGAVNKGAGKPKKGEAATPAGQNMDTGIDELAELLAWEQAHKPKLDRIKTLKEKYSKRVREGTWAADEEAVVEGPEYDLIYSACRKETTITNAKLAHELMGDDVFYAVVKIPTGELSKYLPEQQLARVAATTQTGSRTLKMARRRGP